MAEIVRHRALPAVDLRARGVGPDRARRVAPRRGAGPAGRRHEVRPAGRRQAAAARRWSWPPARPTGATPPTARWPCATRWPWSASTPTRWSTTTCRPWTTTTCAAAGPPSTWPSTRPPRCWSATGCSRWPSPTCWPRRSRAPPSWPGCWPTTRCSWWRGSSGTWRRSTGRSTRPGCCELMRTKTGALLAASVAGGARCAGADAAAVYPVGLQLGLAFQIADDLLDLTADTATLGKRAGKDAAAGKATLPALVGPAAARARAEALLGRGARPPWPRSARAPRRCARWPVTSSTGRSEGGGDHEPPARRDRLARGPEEAPRRATCRGSARRSATRSSRPAPPTAATSAPRWARWS